jgi:hypothetical protein
MMSRVFKGKSKTDLPLNLSIRRASQSQSSRGLLKAASASVGSFSQSAFDPSVNRGSRSKRAKIGREDRKPLDYFLILFASVAGSTLSSIFLQAFGLKKVEKEGGGWIRR